MQCQKEPAWWHRCCAVLGNLGGCPERPTNLGGGNHVFMGLQALRYGSTHLSLHRGWWRRGAQQELWSAGGFVLERGTARANAARSGPQLRRLGRAAEAGGGEHQHHSGRERATARFAWVAVSEPIWRARRARP